MTEPTPPEQEYIITLTQLRAMQLGKEDFLIYDAVRSRPAQQPPDALAEHGRKIVTLCGSVRFWDEYRKWNAILTLNGCIVLSCGLSLKSGYEDVLKDYTTKQLNEIKYDLDDIHLRKIDLSDEIFVLDVDGYIGDSTKREIQYALKHGKVVNYLSKYKQVIARLRGELPDALAELEPSYEELVEFARWSQTLWERYIVIMRREGIVIDNLNDKMQKLAFSLYTDLCEIDSKVSHLFREGWGDKNDKTRGERK